MDDKLKPGRVRSSTRKSVTKASNSRGRRAASAPDLWAQQVTYELLDEIDCRRIVEGYGGRSLPHYFDDYN
ncbi:MAG: hypothetical protein ABIH03_15125 [Pseudomonadota bacterium]